MIFYLYETDNLSMDYFDFGKDIHVAKRRNEF